MSEDDPEGGHSPKRRATFSEGIPILPRKRKYELQQIAEEVEEEQTEERVPRRSSTPLIKKQKPLLQLPKIKVNGLELPTHQAAAVEEPIIEPKRRSKSVNSGFRMLKSYPGVTNHLITKADRAAFIKRKRKPENSSRDYRRNSPPRFRSAILPSLKPMKGGASMLSGLHPTILEKMKTSILPKVKNIMAHRSASRHREHLSSSSSSARESAERSETDSNATRSAIQSRSVSRIRRGRMKSKFASNLDKGNETLKQIFKTICKYGERGVKKVTQAAFKSFLSARYPEAFVDTISRYFSFGDGVIFEAYIGEFEKFLSVPDDRLLYFVFDVFDTNRDHYLCFADTFLMISQRKSDCYDRDLLKLKQMFYLKKSRNAPRKQPGGRRNSFYNQIGEDEESRAKRKKVPYYNPDRPEALTFEDFTRVEFGGKPQFFQDFLKYTCAITPSDAFGTLNSIISRQNTEDVLAEASLSLGAYNLLAKDERAGYFKELQEIISQFSHAESQVILSKFRVLKASGTARKMLSRESVRRNFKFFFGADCEYIAERFFELLSGRKGVTVTKPRFCRHVLKLMRGNTLTHAKWVFKLYDADGDGVISVPELYDMQVNLPPDSPVYLECSKLVNIVVKSLLSGTGNKNTETFDFESFYEIVPSSCIVKEFLGALTDPSPSRMNISFTPPKKEDFIESSPLKLLSTLVKHEVNLSDILRSPQKSETL
mmetsp:Transcript_9856/g.19519  ORF Transcript_9856/g.19519 Transcript_9856/m.19519 type:complete len:712 (+) Transcript_9856:3126-5261(+)